MKEQARSGNWIVAAALICFVLAGPATSEAAVRNVEGGIEFSYFAPSANQVFLAGSFNGWNATQLALTNDGKGNWTIVHTLGQGSHEYKFVADGAWFADPENPDTVPDPYGGANSLVQVGSDGKLVEAATAAGVAAAQRPRSNTPLNARVYISGRYLTRYEFEQNRESVVETAPGDPASATTLTEPRYRLQRPQQKVDLNFYTTVSDAVDSYTRLRLDNQENIIQNNISGFLDEASLDVHSDNFHVIAYWDMEVFTQGDPLGLGGDRDLPGTIFDDHLDSGKGTAGALFEADPWNFHFQGYFANVHDADLTNDRELYDDTGKDLYGLRLSRQVEGFEFGLPAYIERELIWMDFGEVVGQEETGIPRLDDYLLAEGDPSTWFEFERRDIRAGVDATYRFWNRRAVASLEYLIGEQRQAFVTGNDAGDNNENGSIDLPVLDRKLAILHGSLDLDLNSETHLNLEHTGIIQTDAEADESVLVAAFLPQDEANRNIFFTISGAPALTQEFYTEATLDWTPGDRRHLLWWQRRELRMDIAAVNADIPESSEDASATISSWSLAALNRLGQPDGSYGRWELETSYSNWHADPLDEDLSTFEAILRAERNLTPKLAVLADVRFINYEEEFHEETGEEKATKRVTRAYEFWAPYGGLRYRPNAKVEIVVAYGVDPLDFRIDYSGRHEGRWWHRQRHSFENPDHSLLQAEQSLEDARVIGLRAQFNF